MGNLAIAINDADMAQPEFLTPVPAHKLAELIDRYKRKRADLEEFYVVVSQDKYISSVNLFIEGAKLRIKSTDIFDLKLAIATLNSDMWSSAMQLTDVYDYMPQKRRDEWYDQIREKKTPDFEEATVRSTMMDMLNNRARFFSEKIDGIFRALSRSHVTNSPQGFGKRMIIANAIDKFGYPDHTRKGYIDDLRHVIAKFMNRDTPSYGATGRTMAYALSQGGDWIEMDGGALRIRVYKVGTAHIEIHPEISWRLNQMLANLYPMAIPAAYRTKPPKPIKDFDLRSELLSFSTIEDLIECREATKRNEFGKAIGRIPNTLTANSGHKMSDEISRVLTAIGGVSMQHYFQFDYDPTHTVARIIAEGKIPEQKSHQYYPTPESIAEVAIALAKVGETDRMTWGEFSAGQGNLAQHMPKARTQCVEISALHCDILRAKGYLVDQADFLEWAKTCKTTFDRAVINPPYSESRWQLHTEIAAKLIAPNGRLVAILPTNAKTKLNLGEGWSIKWSAAFEKEFKDTGISVVIMSATRL